MKLETSELQMSDSLLTGCTLALSGGFMDGYTYILRGEVFANAQTGNMLLFGVNLSEGNFAAAVSYIYPVFMFVLGVFTAQLLRIHCSNRRIHWRQLSVLFEIIILFAVGFMGTDINLTANSFVSFACGIQVQSFRKVHKNAFATTMCIGNIRSATDCFCEYLHSHDPAQLKKSLIYYGVIACFIAGAVMGNFGVRLWDIRAVWVCPLLLSCVFGLMMFSGAPIPPKKSRSTD